MSSYTLKVSSHGQVSIPAEVRRRWKASRVLVIDKGDRVIIRPVPDDPIATVTGKYSAGPPSDEMRAVARAEEAEREDSLE